MHYVKFQTETTILNTITTVHIYIYIFYTADFQDDLPISKHVATLEIKHTSLELTECFFFLLLCFRAS